MPTAESREPVTILPGEITREYLLHYGVCPYEVTDDNVHVAVAPATPDSRIAAACGELTRIYSRTVVRVPTDAQSFQQRVEKLATVRDAVELEHNVDVPVDTDARNLATQPPVVRYVNFLLKEAHDQRASDIHVETRPDGTSDVRFRIDGVLVPGPDAPAGLHAAVVSRIKLLASLDIAERRRPQDGRIRARLDADAVDLRVSTVPTFSGESVVIRLLNHGGAAPDLAALGMPADILQAVVDAAERSHGLILVTGPTGSGKTTTLYGTLSRRSLTSEKVVTVEDPVEYQLDRVTQVPVNRQAGVTFASALRSLLRQDPDVMMIGEMRDAETAEIAIQAATTGHLVFSTMHTNDAVGAVIRTRDLGVAPFLLAATLELVLAQRLVRVVCASCREEYTPRSDTLALAARFGLPLSGHVRGKGCGVCHGTGYRGRTGVFEMLAVSSGVREAIAREATHGDLTRLATEDGMRPLTSHASHLVGSGVTTVQEVIRAVL